MSLLVLAATATAQTAPAIEDARQSSEYWQLGKEALAENAAKRPIYGTAKNVILFVGDGMGPTTVTAGRIYEGQHDGDDLPGVRNVLGFEGLPHLALSKTYNINVQVPDSAGTMTAITTGVKTDEGLINYMPGITRADCSTPAEKKITPLFALAETAGLATGVVSTARITHATPAATYAQVVDRDFESDTDVLGIADYPSADCADIATQLVDFPYGDGIELALGGGRRAFLRQDQTGPEGDSGRRTDRDLTAEWAAKPNHAVAMTKGEFEALPKAGVKVLGLFESSHMQYDLDRDDSAGGEPSLAEMTSYAIDNLSADPDGYMLVVEAGRIDHAHHEVNAAKAMGDTRAFDEAIKAALAKVDLRDTLVVVTADHGHVFTFSGYPTVDNDILGLADGVDAAGKPLPGPVMAGDGKPYTTLSYANGPSSPFFTTELVTRRDLTGVDTTDKDFHQDALVPAGSETHGGQDVAIYAGGPKAYLFDGTVEQSYIFHVMDESLALSRKVETAQRLGAARGRGR
ncbi:alkaline phosphatase [Parvularcula dongshanensis]|uniref:Alkaline phosphatase n=1 Tax=Parvularcula dongshanensis TaxID=1173995 RepID=A0A840I0M0_9PROT|nr:alkaline phosphatase [Parvularcula dongshanensis]